MTPDRIAGLLGLGAVLMAFLFKFADIQSETDTENQKRFRDGATFWMLVAVAIWIAAVYLR